MPATTVPVAPRLFIHYFFSSPKGPPCGTRLATSCRIEWEDRKRVSFSNKCRSVLCLHAAHGLLSGLGVVTNAMVYFFADPTIAKNVLDRLGWLDRVRLGLVHHDSKIYLGPPARSRCILLPPWIALALPPFFADACPFFFLPLRNVSFATGCKFLL